jgi:hypothetical protein
MRHMLDVWTSLVKRKSRIIRIEKWIGHVNSSAYHIPARPRAYLGFVAAGGLGFL